MTERDRHQGPSLSEHLSGLLPTPLASSGRQVGERTNTRSGRTLLEAADKLLPTPTSTEFKRANTDAQRAGTKGGRRLSAEASMLPTPTTRPNSHRSGHDAHGKSDRGTTLAEAADKLLPTPRASDATKGARSMPERDGKEGPTLPEAINRLRERGMLPTTCSDAKAAGTAGNWTPESGRNSGATLTDVAVRGLDTPSISSGPSPTSGAPTGIGGGRLNPAFVEWMMGLPTGWVSTSKPTPTNSTSSATASSGKRRAQRSSSSGTDSTAQISLFSTEPKDDDDD